MSTDKTDAWMPLWIGAYLADTTSLTTLQHGAYLLLLMAYWRERGPLLDDDEDLQAITKTDRATWAKLRPKLLRFFTIVDGRWSHKRVEAEMLAANTRKAGAVSKAKAAAEARWGQAGADAPSIPQALPGDCPTPSPSKKRRTPPPPKGGAEGFDDFWQAYPAIGDRKAAKAQCEAKWVKRSCAAIKDRILAALAIQKALPKWHEDNGRFVPAPLVWLNQERWVATEEAQADAPKWWETVRGANARAAELGLPKWDETIPFAEFVGKVKSRAAVPA